MSVVNHQRPARFATAILVENCNGTDEFEVVTVWSRDVQTIERHKIGSVMAGLFVLCAMVGAVIWLVMPTMRNIMNKPRAEHRKEAKVVLQDIIGEDSEKLAVPAVNNDIGLIYVTAPLTAPSVENIKAQGRPVKDMPGEIYEFAKPNRKVLIDLKTSPSKIMVGADGDTENAQQCVLRYREWLEGKKLPWP